ncbi:MAG: hypothetical protein KBF45_11335 [Cyclobacteriaceae bacterium]|nr:hypothetical protein [Cyclobacteriaceae bacterium]
MKFHLKHTIGIDSAFSPDAQFLFNTAPHLRLQAGKGWQVFEYVESTRNIIYARISFLIKGSEARSPMKAPFGSVEIYRKLTQKQVEEFVEQVEQQLRILAVKKIFIRHHPDCYDEKKPNVWRTCLRNLQFQQAIDITSIILVDDRSFEKKIKISERQKLHKAARVLTFERVNNIELKSIYAFIDACRKERNQSLSMTLTDLKKLLTVFPDRVLLFKVGAQSTLSAAAIVILVSPKILYTFYYAHAKIHDRISPVVFLLSGIYDFGRKHKIKMIDLGTSMTDQKLNKSLLHFKKSIGGISDNKSTFTKILI